MSHIDLNIFNDLFLLQHLFEPCWICRCNLKTAVTLVSNSVQPKELY